jgi:hypothetical protein
MTTIIQYRYFENETLIGEGPVQTFDPVDPALIPVIGDQFPLYPSTEGYGKVIAIEDEVKAEPDGTNKKRFITLTIERI